jgi:hypothetical protein
MNDKYGVIKEMAERLGIERKSDISKKLDVQFQPRGNRGIAGVDFFGEQNLQRIERICASRMNQFGYSTSLAESIQ